LIVDAALEASGAPIHELDGSLGLDGGNCRIHILWHHISWANECTLNQVNKLMQRRKKKTWMYAYWRRAVAGWCQSQRQSAWKHPPCASLVFEKKGSEGDQTFS
jgi:hypothetical protein